MQKETKALRERKLCQAAAAVSPSGDWQYYNIKSTHLPMLRKVKKLILDLHPDPD